MRRSSSHSEDCVIVSTSCSRETECSWSKQNGMKYSNRAKKSKMMRHGRSKNGEKNSKWLAYELFATDNRKFALFSKCAYSISLFMCLWCAPVRDTSCIIALAHLIADDFHFLFHVKFVCVLITNAVLAAHNSLFQFCFPRFYFANFPFRSFSCFIIYVVWLSVCSFFPLIAKEMGVSVSVCRER